MCSKNEKLLLVNYKILIKISILTYINLCTNYNYLHDWSCSFDLKPFAFVS